MLASKDFNPLSGGGAGSGGADDPSDSTTYFFADDNGSRLGLTPFNDGDQFYYYITARDILGRDGLVSPGGLATACRKIKPSAPLGLSVKNSFKPAVVGGVATNTQQLVLSWAQNTNPTNYVTEYWVYRWNNPSDAMTNDPVPLTNRIAVVASLPGTNSNQYLDNDTDAPLTPGSTNFWYTVRAVSQAICGPLLSQHSAPAWGVLREYTAPNAATGQVYGSCGTPAVMYQSINFITNSPAASTNTWTYRFTCKRRDPGIAWVLFTVYGDTASSTLGPVYFPPGGDTVSVDFSEPIGLNASPSGYVACQVGNYYGATSPNANLNLYASTVATTEPETVFMAGQLLGTALNSSDPLLTSLDFNQPYCATASTVKPYPDGTVALTFPFVIQPSGPLQIQVLSNAAWVDVGAAWPDTNHVYWISYPACLLGPLPTFKGCSYNLPDTGNCGQHIARSGNSGPVAPIIVSFSPTPRSREYRLYRRIDDGPQSLISQGTATYDSANPSRLMIVVDDPMPPSSAEICYFVQMLDENGNGSPLSPIGCLPVKPPSLPAPVLSEPAAMGDTNNPQVSLTWFCPPEGVHRFQIQIERADQPASGKPSGFSSPKLSKLATTVVPKFYYAGIYTLQALLASQSALPPVSHFDEGYLTPPIGVNFGPGPQFSTTANVLAGVPYNISIVSTGYLDEPHQSSKTWQFIWKPTNAVDHVPWPARPLPPVTQFDEPGGTNQRVAAVLLYNISDGNPFFDKRYPVGIRIGTFQNHAITNSYNNYAELNVGFTNFPSYSPLIPSENDPATFLFTRFSKNPQHNGEKLLPIVVYRQQVANSAFPKVSGSLVQVTPLVEKLASQHFPGYQHTSGSTVIFDPLVAIGKDPQAVVGLDVPFPISIYLRDQQPVITGASYHYYVTRMNSKHEVAEIIDAGTVTIPPQ